MRRLVWVIASTTALQLASGNLLGCRQRAGSGEIRQDPAVVTKADVATRNLSSKEPTGIPITADGAQLTNGALVFLVSEAHKDAPDGSPLGIWIFAVVMDGKRHEFEVRGKTVRAEERVDDWVYLVEDVDHVLFAQVIHVPSAILNYRDATALVKIEATRAGWLVDGHTGVSTTHGIAHVSILGDEPATAKGSIDGYIGLYSHRLYELSGHDAQSK